jgi:hypothetical protein
MVLADADGQKVKDRITSIREAVIEGVSFCVVVDQAVLAADGDSDDAPEVAQTLFDELANEGLRPVILASGRSGGRHVFARITEPEVLTQFKFRAKGLGFDLREGGSRIRPPLSPHTSGYEVRLLVPTTPALALSALRRAPLRETWWALLREGVQQGKRSERILSFLLAAVNAGYSKSWCRTVLLNAENGLSEKLLEIVEHKSERAATAWFEHSFARAVHWVEGNPASREKGHVDEAINAAWASVDSVSWQGQVGRTDRCVLQAHLRVADAAGSTTWTASCRQIAEGVGMARSTIISSQRRLRAAGLLVLLALGTGEMASTWTLGNALKDTTKSHAPLGRPSGSLARDGNLVLQVGHDASRRGALGATGAQIHQALVIGSATAPDLATCLCLHPGTVRKRLKQLADAQLAVREVTGVWHALDATEKKLLDVSRFYGTDGAGKRQTARHQLERKAYRGVRARGGRRYREARERGRESRVQRRAS